MLTRFDVAEVITAPLGASAEFDPATRPRVPCAPTALSNAGDALAATRAKFPDMELSSLFLPTPENPVYRIWLRPAQKTVPLRGNVEVISDAQCGTVLFSRGAADMQAGDTVLTYLVGLHNGRLLGLFGEGLIVAQGLALAELPLAGITMFMRRRGRRKVAEKRRSKIQNANEPTLSFTAGTQ